SRTDYAILGSVSENRIEYQIKISTTFQTIDEGFVEGTIPFHLISTMAQRIKTRMEIKETKVTSVEQIFRGNVSLLQQYSIGVHAFRRGKYAEADRALRLALNYEPNFSPALIYLARTQQERGLREQAKESAQSGVFQVSDLPYSLASLIKAQYYGFAQKHEEAAEIYHEFHNQFPDVTEYLVWWGEALVKADRLEEAANVFYEICEKESKSGLGWLRLAWIEFLQEKYEQAWYHYKRAQKLYQSLNHFGGLAATYMGVAQVSEKRADWNSAVDYYQRAVEAFTKINWLKGIAKAKYQLALSLRKQSSYSAVLPLLRESLNQFHELGDLYGEFLCLRQMLSEPLEISEALDLSDRVLVTASEIQDDKLTASVIPLKMRWLVESRHPDAVLRLYSSYYNLLVLSSPDLYFSLSQMQVTRALIQQQRFTEAHQHIEQAIRILGKTNNPYLVVRGMLVRCELFLLEGNKEQAQDYVDATGLIAEKLSDRELALDVEIMRGRILESEGDRVQLLQVYLTALRLAEDLNNTTQMRNIKGQIEQLRAMKTQS
ncbi:MAG TPA: hypothetical protein VJ521_13760, partial [Acidobacteriota bacterium]|nr:hypothetical protein [Acidobacteriota bacterium]